MKKFAVILMLIIFTSCAGLPKTPEQETDDIDTSIIQQSVVEDELASSMRFKNFKILRTPGPVIPGLLQNAVPQGMAYWKEEDLMLISAYMSDQTAGVIIILEMNTGNMYKTLTLYNSDRSPHTGHLGELAADGSYLWIASGQGVFPVRLDIIKNAADGGKIFLPEIIPTETKASFATYNSGTLWVGEFTRSDRSYPVSELHRGTNRTGKLHFGWLAGYNIDISGGMLSGNQGENEMIIPDYILSIPEEIQGAVFADGKIILSASYGRRNNSRLLIYNSPLSEPSPHEVVNLSGSIIPLWYLDDLNKSAEVEMPPMSEAAVFYKSLIAVLFESAASKYRNTSSFPLDRIQYIQFEEVENLSGHE